MNKIILKLNNPNNSKLDIYFKNNEYTEIIADNNTGNKKILSDYNDNFSYIIKNSLEITGNFTNIRFNKNNIITEIIEFDCNNLLNLNRTFHFNTGLVKIHKNAFKNTNHIKSMLSTFDNCILLNDISNNFINDLDSLECIDFMFNSCSNLQETSDNIFLEAPKLKSASYLFNDSGLRYIPNNLFRNNLDIEVLSNCFTNTNVVNMPLLFLNNHPELHCIMYMFSNTKLEYVNKDFLIKSINMDNVEYALDSKYLKNKDNYHILDNFLLIRNLDKIYGKNN